MIKFVSIFFIFVFYVNVSLAASDISQFAFTTDSQTIKPDEVSEIIAIQAQNSKGDYATSTQTICIELASNSNAGEFSSSNTNWNSVEVLTMSKGSANRNFYYKDSAAGIYEISAKISFRPEGKPACASWPKEEWDIKWNIKQNITVSPGSSLSLSSASSQSYSNVSSVNSGGGSIYWPEEPQIYANAGKDKTGIAGADVLFEAKALGIKKEPLQNARYLWNFGDGASGEGKNIKHVYKYPGNYIAVLDVSSGQYSVSDKINVKIIPNKLEIIEAGNDFVKFKNGSDAAVDVSGWFVKEGQNIFTFPANSFIGAGAELVISSDVSKIKFAGNDGAISLLYPNGSSATIYQNKKEIKSQPILATTSSSASKVIKIINPVKNFPEKPTKPKPTSDVGFATATQPANVIYSSEKAENAKDYKKWLFLAVFLGLSSAGALFLVRRNGGA